MPEAAVRKDVVARGADRVSPRRRRWVWSVACAVAIVAALGAAAEYVLRNAEPLLRRRVVASLEQRFHSPVELDELHISLLRGVQVTGRGLRILEIAGPTQPDKHPELGEPMLSVDRFAFHSGFRQLLEPTLRIATVTVDGMEIRIPPKSASANSAKAPRTGQPKLSLLVDRIVCRNIRLVIESAVDGKPPLVFPLRNVYVRDVGMNQPLEYDAFLQNPKPVGDIRAIGHFGPWDDTVPRDTPVDGVYAFTNADLGTIKGVAGILSSTGKFSGQLGTIHVLGSTDTPRFALDLSQHPIALHTDFDATVDGTTGDTTLNQVRATLLHSVLFAAGSVVRSQDRAGTAAGGLPGDNPEHVPGHTIDLTVRTDNARMEDLLELASRASPPLLSGATRLRTHLVIPPGRQSVTQKMRLDGTFAISGARFSNARWQQLVDVTSERASGRPERANPRDARVVTSQLAGSFSLAQATVHVSSAEFRIPGADVRLTGDYGLDRELLEFTGTVRTEATASQMIGGWKSWLAKPFDGLLKKNGAGLELPIKISGTRSDPQFGVDLDKLGLGFLTGHDNPGQSSGRAPASAGSGRTPR